MISKKPDTWEQWITLTSAGSEEAKRAIQDVEYGLDLISGDLSDPLCKDLVLGESQEASFHCRYFERPGSGGEHIALDSDIDPQGRLTSLCDGGNRYLHTLDNKVKCFKMSLR